MKKTFIKMQSLSRKAWLCGGLIAMAAALVGCSSDAPDPGDNNPNPGVVQTDGDPLTVISDQATLSALLQNHDEYEAEDDFKAFNLPKVPDYSDAAEVSADGKILSDGKIKITEEYEGTLNAYGNDVDIFIEGAFKGDIINGGKVTVHILDKGVWNATTDSKALSTPNLTIYDYDEGLVCPDKCTMQCNYYGKTFNQPGKKINLGIAGDKDTKAEFFVEGAIIAKELNMTGNKMQIKANCLVVEKAYITSHNNIKNYVGSYIHAKEELKMGPKAQFSLGNNAYVRVEGELFMDKNSVFKTNGTASIKVGKLYTDDRSKGNDKPKGNSNGTFNMGGKFQGMREMNVYIGELWEVDGKEHVKRGVDDILGKINENVHFYGSDELKKDPITECLPVDGGNGGGGNPDPVDPNPGPAFPNNPEIFVEIYGGDGNHTHEISATGIDVSGNKAYISWHERGGSIKGCIETLEINQIAEGKYTAAITSWMETPRWEYVAAGNPTGANAETAYDFNHIIYDQEANAVIVVGEHAKKGGIIGRVLLNRTSGVTGELGVLENRQLGVEEYEGNTNTGLIAGGSGNCVVISPKSSDGKKYLLVASRGGYQKIPYGDIQSVNDPFAVGEGLKHLITSKMMKAISTNGSGKHLALYDNSLVSIEYTAQSPDNNPYWWKDNTTALPAKISLWENWEDFLDNQPAYTATVDAFSPVFGKDVIAMDENYIYSCQGHNGVAIYNKSLQEVARFNVKDCYAKNIGQCRNSLSSKESESAAANGLAVDDEYIYIAYGAAGLWVLDKSNFKPVGFYNSAVSTYPSNDKEHPKASANYVKVMNDDGIKKILVAYGREGVKVFKMPLGK